MKLSCSQLNMSDGDSQLNMSDGEWTWTNKRLNWRRFGVFQRFVTNNYGSLSTFMCTLSFCYSLLLGQFQLKLFYYGKGRQNFASNVNMYPCEPSRQNYLVTYLADITLEQSFLLSVECSYRFLDNNDHWDKGFSSRLHSDNNIHWGMGFVL